MDELNVTELEQTKVDDVVETTDEQGGQPLTDYKKMFEEQQKQNEALTKQIEELKNANTRLLSHAGRTEPTMSLEENIMDVFGNR